MPDAMLVRAVAADVVSRLLRDGFELTAAGMVAWVDVLGSAQQDDLRQDQRPLAARRAHRIRRWVGRSGRRARCEGRRQGLRGLRGGGGALVAHATHATDSGGDSLREALAAEAGAAPPEGVCGEADDAPRGDGS